MQNTNYPGQIRNRFEDDVFISYTWKSNVFRVKDPETGRYRETNNGWVTEFHQAMMCWFGTMNPNVRIFRDESMMETGTQIPDAIMRRIEESAIFMGVLCPAYVMSYYCRAEATHFFRLYGEERIFSDPNQTRIFNIARTPIKVLKELTESKSLPQEFFDIKAKEFFEYDGTEQKFIEDESDANYHPGSRFGKKLNEFCLELYKALKFLSPIEEGEQRCVYLAHATRDLLGFRNDIRTHLEHHGYTVQQILMLPSERLTESELRQKIATNLSECCFSIHFFNEVRGQIDEGFEKPLIQLEYEIAKMQENWSQIAWIPQGKRSQITQPDYKAFIDTIEADKHFLETGFEELKDEVDEVLAHLAASSQPAAKIQEFEIVCLIHHPHDHLQGIEPIAQTLGESNCEVVSHCVDSIEINQDCQNDLDTATGILVYWGESDQRWVRARINEIRTRLEISNRSIPIGLYITQSFLSQRRFYQPAQNVEVIRQGEDLIPDCLDSFIRRLNLGEGVG
ncbi:toll/interleukin-1 receptor domain-containing protein [Phormidesmis sp. 146-35]